MHCSNLLAELLYSNDSRQRNKPMMTLALLSNDSPVCLLVQTGPCGRRSTDVDFDGVISTVCEYKLDHYSRKAMPADFQPMLKKRVDWPFVRAVSGVHSFQTDD